MYYICVLYTRGTGLTMRCSLIYMQDVGGKRQLTILRLKKANVAYEKLFSLLRASCAFSTSATITAAAAEVIKCLDMCRNREGFTRNIINIVRALQDEYEKENLCGHANIYTKMYVLHPIKHDYSHSYSLVVLHCYFR